MENYLYWLQQHAVPNVPVTDEDKNRLVYSLLGTEATAHFASNPSARRLSQATFVEFLDAVKHFSTPSQSPTHAFQFPMPP